MIIELKKKMALGNLIYIRVYSKNCLKYEQNNCEN